MINIWHATNIKEIFSVLDSNSNGLSNQEALDRLNKYGKNILPEEKKYSKIKLFLGQFNSPLMYILLVTVGISFLLKHYSDSIFILFILFINTTVGFYQENKANKSLAALKKMVKVKARVLRNGLEKEIDSQELVIGDILMLKSGDKVPADAIIVDSRGLKINESSLTGESHPVDKKEGVLEENATLPERTNMVFMGTIVEQGRGKMLVVAIGSQTQMGKIVSLLKETKERKTPLQKKILVLSRWLSVFVLSLITIILIEGHFTEKSFVDVFVASLALAVSAIPEGLLPAITVILVLAMRRIFKEGGLVRKLAATETLGGVTIICTDKTGTLTEGKMNVVSVLTSNKELMNEDMGELMKDRDLNDMDSHISALKIATMVNDAFIENPESALEEWIVRGAPTDRALLLAGMHAGLDKRELEKQYPLIDRINFESEYKFAATFNKKDEKTNILYIIGAPEEIIAKCSHLDIDGNKEELGTDHSNKLINRLEGLTQKGLRVLGCAYKEYSSDIKYDNLTDLVKEISLIGFIALKDPLRKDAKDSIKITKKAGIRTIIMTGDHKLTARTIAEEIGLKAKNENIMEGKEIDTIDDMDLGERVKNISIFARVSPHHKLKIVNALQSGEDVVAMIGDGVNDAPALKAADIGVAVGAGTDVAKEVADLVLLDNNFKIILKAIEQGRVVFQNIRKVFVYLMADDFSELFLFLFAMAMGLPLPLLPAQILWINLVEDGFPDIALTTEQETEGVMEEKPRSIKEKIFSQPIKKWMTAIFFISGIAAFATYLSLFKFTGDIDKTRSMVFVLMCIDSLIFAFSVRSFKESIFRKNIFSNRFLVGGVAIGLALLFLAVYAPPLQKILSTQPLRLIEWALLMGISIVEILFIEFAKKKIFSKEC
ncbi:MAG: HAD-IC family P-type ATPase [Candidatus Paceibacterota bacterium]|jgi:Ca2+-transporting ATPase